MNKLPHQFNFHMEHEKCIFSATVGSRLIGADNQNSDIDTISFYSHKININPFFEYPVGNEIVSIENTDVMNETCNVLLANFASMILKPKDLQSNTYSQIIKHLAAIKFNNIKVIDKERYNIYYDWLCAPGNGFNFWQQSLNAYNNFWNSMPTKDCNWSQKFDNINDEHINKKELWYTFNEGYYPKVDAKLGYDVKYVSWMLTDIILIHHILWQDHIIDERELDFIKHVKEHKVEWEQVQNFKIDIWKNARKSVESPMSSYLLGKGFNIQVAKSKNKYGMKAFIELLENLGVTQ